MYCVVQEVKLKKANLNGYPKELKSCFMDMSIQGQDISHYYYDYSEERFERPIMKAYKISLHQSFRENGKVRKKQYPLFTVNYYDLANGFFSLYDYVDRRIQEIAKAIGSCIDDLFDIVQTKLDPLIDVVENEFKQTEEYTTHAEHERITTVYATNKIEFAEKYDCNKDKYDQIYDVFGNLMNEAKLDEVKADYKRSKEYEEKSRSYQEQSYGNYKDNYSNGSSYSKTIHSNHSAEDKEALKLFYRILSKKFHPDANPDQDTSNQMKLINKLKNEWGV
jgi:hypothetical protein